MSERQKIIGYTPLTDEQVTLINEIKEHGEVLGKLITKMRSRSEGRRNEVTDDYWCGVGECKLRQGIMMLVRSVAQPTTF